MWSAFKQATSERNRNNNKAEKNLTLGGMANRRFPCRGEGVQKKEREAKRCAPTPNHEVPKFSWKSAVHVQPVKEVVLKGLVQTR